MTSVDRLTWMETIQAAKRGMEDAGAEPAEIRMNPKMFVELADENQLFKYFDENFNPLPHTQLFGIDICIDETLQDDKIIIR